MMTNGNRTFAPPRLRTVLCSVFFIAASIAVIGAIGLSRAVGGSASPDQRFAVAKDAGERVPKGADISPESFRGSFNQRVAPPSPHDGVPRENAFHLHLQTNKIAPWVIEHTSNGQSAEFFVVLKDQADLSGAAALATKAEKGRYVS